MNSIRQKFTVLNMVIIFLCTFIVGEEYSDEILQLTCRQESSFLNDEFTDIQRSIGIFADQATDRMPPVDVIRSNAAVRRQYVSEMEKLMGDIVRHSKGVVCYYLRITPELADEVDTGF